MNWPVFLRRVEVKFPMPMEIIYDGARAICFVAEFVSHETGEKTRMQSIWYAAPDSMMEAEAMALIRMGLQLWALHEIDETLYLDGRRPWDPHVAQPQPCRCAECVRPSARAA